MKLIKRISAVVASAAIAATMVVSASAAKYTDVVDTANKSGVPASAVQDLQNFLDVHNAKFTEKQYDEMITAIKDASTKYIAPYCKGGAKQVVDKTVDQLTEDDKKVIGKAMTEAEKKEIEKLAVDTGKKYNVTVTVKDLLTAQPRVYAIYDGTTTGGDKPVANTGAEGTNSGAAAAVAVATLAVAGTGLAVAVKKSRE